MMLYDLKEIKEIRRKFNLTQSALAKKAGVSQSLIAKIEAGKLDPTYSNAQKIFKTLDAMKKKDEIKVAEFMTKKIISVPPESSVQEMVNKMRKYEISQLPVLEKDKLVGYISEADVLDAFTQGKKGVKARDIMADTPPTLTKNASLDIVSDILKVYPLIVIVEQGKLKGVVTKSDILRRVYKKGLFS